MSVTPYATKVHNYSAMPLPHFLTHHCWVTVKLWIMSCLRQFALLVSCLATPLTTSAYTIQQTAYIPSCFTPLNVVSAEEGWPFFMPSLISLPLKKGQRRFGSSTLLLPLRPFSGACQNAAATIQCNCQHSLHPTATYKTAYAYPISVPFPYEQYLQILLIRALHTA